MNTANEFEELIGQYWELAYIEGKTGVPQAGEANEVLRKLRLWNAGQTAISPEPHAWQEISTLPYADDLVWLAHGDSIDGPRPMDTDDYDRYSYWAPCEPPSLGELHPNSMVGQPIADQTGKYTPVAIVDEAMGGIEWLAKYLPEFEGRVLYFREPQQ